MLGLHFCNIAGLVNALAQNLTLTVGCWVQNCRERMLNQVLSWAVELILGLKTAIMTTTNAATTTWLKVGFHLV